MMKKRIYKHLNKVLEIRRSKLLHNNKIITKKLNHKDNMINRKFSIQALNKMTKINKNNMRIK